MTPKYFSNTARLNDVVIIRSIAICMVVAFHAYYMMMVEGHFPASAQMYHDMYFNVNCLILQFRMPLFIFISGYLFSHLENDRGKYATFKELIKNKFKRLIIPFFVFATVFMLSIHDFSLRPYYAWGYQHLWFISMLFWCFIFTRVQSFAPESTKWWWKAGILLVSFLLMISGMKIIPMVGIQYLLLWYFWFYFGYQLYLNRDETFHIINKHNISISFVLAAIFVASCWAKVTVLADDSMRTWYTELGNIAIVLLFWYWINVLIFRGVARGGGNPSLRETQQARLRHICLPQLASTIYNKFNSNCIVRTRCLGNGTPHSVSLGIHGKFVSPLTGANVAPAEVPTREVSDRMKNKNFRYDIAILRLLCIAVVVFFHAYGMTYANHLAPEVAEVYKAKYESLVDAGPINIAMPMFVLISGFLFGGQLLRKQPVSFGKILKSKFMRLLVPFFVFTVVFMFTTNSVSWRPFWQWTYWHLWFLPMLFWCFVLTYFLRPLIMSDKSWIAGITLLAVFALSLIPKPFSPFLGLHCVNPWYCWFALGAWLFKHEHIFKSRITSISITIWGGVSYILLSILFPQSYGDNTIIGEVTSICGIASLWCGLGLVNFKNNRFTSILVGMSGASFGVYIFHNWIEMYMVSSTARSLFRLDQLAMHHTILFPLLFSIIAFIVSYAITHALLETNLGRQLIG